MRLNSSQYAEETYKLEMNASHLSQLNRAITNGAESGMFVLPKGQWHLGLTDQNEMVADIFFPAI